MKPINLEYPICPFCEENKTQVDDNGDVLLCDSCAIYLGERADLVDLINRCDW